MLLAIAPTCYVASFAFSAQVLQLSLGDMGEPIAPDGAGASLRWTLGVPSPALEVAAATSAAAIAILIAVVALRPTWRRATRATPATTRP